MQKTTDWSGFILYAWFPMSLKKRIKQLTFFFVCLIFKIGLRAEKSLFFNVWDGILLKWFNHWGQLKKTMYQYVECVADHPAGG